MRYLSIVFCLWISSFAIVSNASESDTIRYINKTSIMLLPDTVKQYSVTFNDTLGDRVLYQTLSSNGIPITYHRKIITSVCFDGLCRLLDVLLYWTPGGSYHGFELPEGEYLSKTDHDPFTTEEYEKLHHILNDSISPLGDFTFAELVSHEEGASHEGVDAVSSATLTEVQEHVITGAAYTTYRLWHLIYGTTRAEIRKISYSMLKEEMALAMLKNGTLSDQTWVLKNLNALYPLSTHLQNELLTLLHHSNLNLVENTIDAIDSTMLSDKFYQKELVNFLQTADHARKMLLLPKLKMVTHIADEVIDQLVEMLPMLHGEILNGTLELLQEKRITNVSSLQKITFLLQHKNRFVSRKIYDFLLKLNSSEKMVKDALTNYQSTIR